MKLILNSLILTLCLVVGSLNLSAQNSSQKLSAQELKERAEVDTFVASFMQEYYKTYDLTKVSERFFVSNYKKLNTCPCSDEKIDRLLTDEEKFQIQFMQMDLLFLQAVSDFAEVNFEPEKVADKSKKNLPDFLLKRSLPFFQKYPKSMVFLDDGYPPENIDDYRFAMADYRKAVQEIRNSMLNKSFKDKFLNFVSKNKDEMFVLDYIHTCQGDECEGFAEKTKFYHYFAIPFTLIIVKDKSQFKVVAVTFVTR